MNTAQVQNDGIGCEQASTVMALMAASCPLHDAVLRATSDGFKVKCSTFYILLLQLDLGFIPCRRNLRANVVLGHTRKAVRALWCARADWCRRVERMQSIIQRVPVHHVHVALCTSR